MPDDNLLPDGTMFSPDAGLILADSITTYAVKTATLEHGGEEFSVIFDFAGRINKTTEHRAASVMIPAVDAVHLLEQLTHTIRVAAANGAFA
jgi:hypothetical protein